MTGFIHELKRRNVIKVAGIYAVTGWLLIQVVVSIFPYVNLPEWSIRLVILCIALGFPVALVMAWALELTPEGIQKTPTSVGEKRLWTIAVICALLATGWYFRGLPDSSGAPGIEDRSIAVLPFADLSPGGDQVYFGDGIAEEILNLLAKNPELHVAGRTSSFQFRHDSADLRHIGEQLNVAHVLEGSVRKSGSRLRITAQLIDTKTGFHLWSNTYDRELTDIFAVQDQISAAIVGALEATIAGDEGNGPSHSSRATTSEAAYELYLRARALGAQRGSVSLHKAIRLLEAAVVLDPEFADAWGHMSFLYALGIGWLVDIPVDVAVARSRESAERALAIDPQNVDAHLGVGTLKLYVTYDIVGARDALLKAYELAPNNADVVNFVGDYYGRTLDLDKQREFETRATELDPLAAVQFLDLGWMHLLNGETQEAVDVAEHGRELNGDLAVYYESLHDAYLANRQYDDALALEDRIAREFGEDSLQYFQVTAGRLLNTGEFDALRKLLRDLKSGPLLEKFANIYSYVALFHVGMGECDEAAEWLERAYDNHDAFLTYPSYTTSAVQCPDSARWQAFWQRPGFKELSEMRIANGHPEARLY